MMLDPTQVFHLGYVVKNMDRAMKVWQRQGATVAVEPAIDPIQNVSCSLLIWQDAAAIELVAPLPEGNNPVAGRLAKGGGLDHICLFADDVDAAVAKAEAGGAITVVKPCYGAVFDRTLAFVQTREGMTLEFMSKVAVGRHDQDPLERYFELRSLTITG